MREGLYITCGNMTGGNMLVGHYDDHDDHDDYDEEDTHLGCERFHPSAEKKVGEESSKLIVVSIITSIMMIIMMVMMIMRVRMIIIMRS